MIAPSPTDVRRRGGPFPHGSAATFFVLAVSMWLSGFAGCARRPPVARPYPAPTVDELMQRLADHQHTFVALNARARATSWLGGDRIRATVLMLVDREGRLRFEAEISLQGTVAVLATDGERFALLDVPHNQLRRGPACPKNVASLIRIPLASTEIAAILLGDVRIPAEISGTDGVAAARVDWDGERSGDVLVLPRLDGWLRVVFAGAGGSRASNDVRIVAATATSTDGAPRWRVSFEDFAAAMVSAGPDGSTSRTIPTAKTIRFAEGSASFDDGVEIKFKDRSFNQKSALDAFAISPSPGTQTLEVDCP